MVTPQGSRAKEDKKKTKRRLCEGRQAKIGVLIEDSSWSVFHWGWAGLACSDFTFIHANINGGLLSDPMPRVSLGNRRVGGWREERRERLGMDVGWVIYVFTTFICSLVKLYHVCLRVCMCVVACVFICGITLIMTDSQITTQTPRHNHGLEASNTGNNDSLIWWEKQQKSLAIPQRAAWLEVTSLFFALFP